MYGVISICARESQFPRQLFHLRSSHLIVAPCEDRYWEALEAQDLGTYPHTRRLKILDKLKLVLTHRMPRDREFGIWWN